MNYYYINREADMEGFHQVHKRGCVRIPAKLKFLGEFGTCEAALVEAEAFYSKVSCCSACTESVLVKQ